MRRLSLGIAALLACAAPSPRAEGWRIIGPGGGGSIFHATISPHDSRTALVACDMTGAYLTHDGGATWRIFNLGEPVQFFVFDPTNARVIYAKALGVLSERRPHAMIVDIAMPGMDGHALLGRIRELGGGMARIPAIALTAFARDEDRRRALASGFQVHLTKPVDSAALLTAIATLRRADRRVIPFSSLVPPAC